MNKYLFENIDWGHLKKEGYSKDEAFEYLCADFMKIRFNLKKAPSIGGITYQGTEGPPLLGPDGLLYGFQAKFSNKSFVKDKLFGSCQKIWDGTQVLGIFTKDSYPSDNTKTVKKYKKSEVKSTKFYWDNYLIELEKDKKLKIYNFCGNNFINELKKEKYWELCMQYFDGNNLKKEIYEKSYNKKDVCDKKLNDEIKNVETGFKGNYNQNNIDLAKDIQQSYSYRKLAYSTKPFVMENFDKMEKFIAEKTFNRLGFYDFENIDEYIDKGISVLDKNNEIIKNYNNELDNMISGKEGIFINYGTQGKSILNYIEKDKIKFIDKRI